MEGVSIDTIGIFTHSYYHVVNNVGFTSARARDNWHHHGGPEHPNPFIAVGIVLIHLLIHFSFLMSFHKRAM